MNNMKLKKIDPQKAERKPCYAQDYTHEHGRSRVIVKCPFCGRANIAYIWSLAGSGKRCGNDNCRAHLFYGVAVRDMVPVEQQPLDMDPSTIDLKMAVEMTGHDLSFLDGEGKGLTISSNFFPEIIDFNELEKIKPPEGYKVEVYSRELVISITSFNGMCPGAVHYYCDIKFSGPNLVRISNGCCGFGPSWPKVGRIFGCRTLNVNRPVTADDLADKHVDWHGYKVGDMTHRWTNVQNAIKCAKKIIKLRFKNYGNVEVKNYT